MQVMQTMMTLKTMTHILSATVLEVCCNLYKIIFSLIQYTCCATWWITGSKKCKQKSRLPPICLPLQPKQRHRQTVAMNLFLRHLVRQLQRLSMMYQQTMMIMLGTSLTKMVSRYFPTSSAVRHFCWVGGSRTVELWFDTSLLTMGMSGCSYNRFFSIKVDKVPLMLCTTLRLVYSNILATSMKTKTKMSGVS